MKVEKIKGNSKITDFQEDDERKIGSILILLDEMYKMRFVENISRPISQRQREKILNAYKKKFD
jgi:hypothetical protein